jgi:transglutaminase-like putative cysteine protease
MRTATCIGISILINPFNFNQINNDKSIEKIMRKKLLILGIVFAWCGLFCSAQSSAKSEAKKAPAASGIVYSNPRVYNVDYCFEIFPDPNKIDRAKDLKVWIPIPREWDSQKAVKIISVQPEPHARYVDPEHGNPMLFWDFGKMAEQTTYKVDIKFRLESYDIDVEVDPERVGSYDKTSKEYALYTRSTHTISITPKIRELAREAVGDETNPYLQAKRIVEFVMKKVNFRVLDFERGRGIKCLLDYPVIDEKTGEEYYEGSCTQFTALTVALCREVGIPARSVTEYMGWCPWVKRDDLNANYPFETKLSPEGLAATQLYGGLIPHMWGEFFIPNYGWIKADALLDTLETIEHKSNRQWIMYKGRDIQVGPYSPLESKSGYGAQWVALHDGRADTLFYAVLNIAKIRSSKVTVLHHSDPFPSAGLACYGEPPFTNHFGPRIDKDLRHWRQEVLNGPSRIALVSVPENLNQQQVHDAKDAVDAFICDMLRRQLGDKKFFELVDTYVALRQESNQAVSTSRFRKLAEDIYGEPLDWFFKQWVNSPELPRLKLEKVTVRQDKEGWQVQGRLLQVGEATFRLPIELAIDTKKGREMQKLWINSKAVDFDFHTLNEPLKLTVDPEYRVLKQQKMPPHFSWVGDIYHENIVIYGTLGEAQANKIAAERFRSKYLGGYGRQIMKADTDVNDADLKTKCVFLIGRPETNKIAQQFKDVFPITVDKNKFTWQGVTYDEPTQGVAQIIENPNYAQGLIMMYAGLSPEATVKLCDLDFALDLFDFDCSYVVYDGDKRVAISDWEDVDGNLYWKFVTH